MTTTSRPSWDRDRWGSQADRLLLAVRPFASTHRAGFHLPGGRSGLGASIDALEAFCRTLLLAGFRLAGERGADPLGLAEWYADGIAAGTDPSSSERWPRLDEHPQAKVEAASLALVLDLTREWLWDRLPSEVQRNVVDYLSPAVGDHTYPRINWVWFRLVVQTFLRSVGGPHEVSEMTADLATHDTFVRADGWMADGDTRAFDHYTGWALHLYPTLWARMRGAGALAAARAESDRALLDRFLTDAVRLVGADGSPLLQGRSLAYRFAAAAPFWAGVMAEVPSVAAGQLRRAASRIVEHFDVHGSPNAAGLLDLGWHAEWPDIAQAYSGPGSAYWASFGMLGLSLPADHPGWTAPEVALPSETGDSVVTMRAPGWIVASSVSDGVVRVINHGTDHARPGDQSADSPLYARLGYSTATLSPLDPDSWINPLDNAVVVLDADGNASHRSGMELLELRIDDLDGSPLGVAASRAAAHWVTPDAQQEHHGRGFSGTASAAGTLLVISLVRGTTEVRLARLTDAPARARQLRMGGWPLAGPAAERLRSVVTSPLAETQTDVRSDASPLGASVETPHVTVDAVDGRWVWAVVALTAAPEPAPAGVTVTDTDEGVRVTVVWPDGVTSSTALPTNHPAPLGAGPGPSMKESE